MKRYGMEALGTFCFTFAVVFAGYVGNPIPAGLILMAMIYVGAHISGAHYNPAVSFAFFMRNRLLLEELGLYILSQLCGAVLAIWFFGYTYGTGSAFMPEVSPDTPLVWASGLEGFLTFIFCITILSVCLIERYRVHSAQGVVIGLTLLAIASIGGIFNPAIAGAAFLLSLIQEGVKVGLSPLVVYVIAPFVGGAIAATVYGFLNE